MIGMGALIGAVARGTEVLAVDMSAHKLSLAKRFGAGVTVNAREENVAAAVDAWTQGDGADVTIEAVGLPATFIQAIDLACFAGKVVYIGYSKAPVTYDTKFFNLKELDIMGSRNATLDDFRAVIAHLETVGDDADQLISKLFPFDDAEQAFGYWQQNPDVLKIVVERA